MCIQYPIRLSAVYSIRSVSRRGPQHANHPKRLNLLSARQCLMSNPPRLRSSTHGPRPLPAPVPAAGVGSPIASGTELQQLNRPVFCWWHGYKHVYRSFKLALKIANLPMYRHPEDFLFQIQLYGQALSSGRKQGAAIGQSLMRQPNWIPRSPNFC